MGPKQHVTRLKGGPVTNTGHLHQLWRQQLASTSLTPRRSVPIPRARVEEFGAANRAWTTTPEDPGANWEMMNLNEYRNFISNITGISMFFLHNQDWPALHGLQASYRAAMNVAVRPMGNAPALEAVPRVAPFRLHQHRVFDEDGNAIPNTWYLTADFRPVYDGFGI